MRRYLFSGNAVTSESIAQWAREQTRGLLSPILPPPTGNGASITNAVYFRGEWESRFDTSDTQNRLFYRAGNMPAAKPLMRQSETNAVQLYRGTQFDAARIPYVGGPNHEVALHIVLPHRIALNALTAKDDVTPLVSQFTLTQWDACQSGYENAVVDLILPRFTFRQTHELEKTLYRMGFASAFASDATQAVVSTLPKITKVVQQTYMAVDEKGTTAAALTEIALLAGSAATEPPPRPRIEKFYANRPFLFFLTEEMSGLILFAGVIHDPTN